MSTKPPVEGYEPAAKSLRRHPRCALCPDGRRAPV